MCFVFSASARKRLGSRGSGACPPGKFGSLKLYLSMLRSILVHSWSCLSLCRHPSSEARGV